MYVCMHVCMYVCMYSEVSNGVSGAFGNIFLVNEIEGCYVYHIYALNTELR